MITFRLYRVSLFVLFSCLAPCCFAQVQEELAIPETETITVNTKDGVTIFCTFYPGGFVEVRGDKDKDAPKVEKKNGKETVPIIMLHGWQGRRTEFDALASQLQKMGHAVIVPDLRGHGNSKTRKLPTGEDKEIDAKRLRKEDFEAMVLGDVEAVKKFLRTKNNAGELNIDMLCIVAADSGATVAVNWAAYDWSRKQLPAFKQGRHVKALVLLSPRQSIKGFSLTKSLQHEVVKNGLSIMLVAGQRDRDSARGAKAIFSRLEKYHKIPADPEERLMKQDLFFIQPDTELQGTSLLKLEFGLKVNRSIARFIELRLVRKTEDFPWMERKNPFGTDGG